MKARTTIVFMSRETALRLRAAEDRIAARALKRGQGLPDMFQWHSEQLSRLHDRLGIGALKDAA